MMINLTEYQECCLLTDYLELLKRQGKVKMYSHIPMETYTTSWNAKRKNKRMGVNLGVPDYLIIGKKMLWIEMKRVKGGVISPSQKEWLAALDNAYVCKGFEQAKEILDREL